MAKMFKKGMSLLLAMILVLGQLALPVTAQTIGSETTDPATGDQHIEVTTEQTAGDVEITTEITIDASGDFTPGSVDTTNEADPIVEPVLQESGSGEIVTTETVTQTTSDEQDRPTQIIEDTTTNTETSSSTETAESHTFTEEIVDPAPLDIPIPEPTPDPETAPEPETTPDPEPAPADPLDGFSVDSTTTDTTWEIKEDENGEPMVQTDPPAAPEVVEDSKSETTDITLDNPDVNLDMPVTEPETEGGIWGSDTEIVGMSLNQIGQMVGNADLTFPETLPEGLAEDANKDTPLTGAQIQAILESQNYKVEIKDGKMTITKDDIKAPVLPEVKDSIPVSENDDVDAPTDDADPANDPQWTDVPGSESSQTQNIDQWQNILDADSTDTSVVDNQDGSKTKTEYSQDGSTKTNQTVYKNDDGSYHVMTEITKTQVTERDATPEELVALSFIPAAKPAAADGQTVNTLIDDKGNEYYEVVDASGTVIQTVSGTYVGEREQGGSVISDVIQATPPALAANQTMQTMVDDEGNDYYIVTTTSTGPNGETITTTEEFRATYTTTTTFQTYNAASMKIEEVITTNVMYGQTFKNTLTTKQQERVEEGTVTDTVTVDGTRETYEITTDANGNPVFIYEGKVYSITGEANTGDSYVGNGTGDINAGMNTEDDSTTEAYTPPTWYTGYQEWMKENEGKMYIGRDGEARFGEWQGRGHDRDWVEIEEPDWYKSYKETGSTNGLNEDLRTEMWKVYNSQNHQQNNQNSSYWSQGGGGSDYGLKIYDTTGDDHTTTMFTIVGKNNEVRTVYCVEIDEGASGGVYFSDILTENPEGDEKYENIGEWANNVPELRAVAANGYWGTTSGIGSLEAVKDLLRRNTDLSEEVIEELSEDEAIAGTQAALWEYGRKEGITFQDADILKGWDVDPDSEARVAALHSVLVTLAEENVKEVPVLNDAGEPTDQTQKVYENTAAVEAIDKNAIESVGIKVKDKVAGTASTYNADVSFKLNVTESSINGDLLVEVVDASNTVIGKYRLADDGGSFLINGVAAAADRISNTSLLKPQSDGTYIIPDLQLASGAKFNLKLSGTQHLDEGIIIYQQKGLQDFISLVSKDNSVNVNVEMGFTVTEPSATKYTEKLTQSASQTITYEKKDTRTLSKLVEDTITGGAEGWTEGSRKITVSGSLVVDVESTAKTQSRKTTNISYPVPTETVPTETTPTETTPPDETTPPEDDIPEDDTPGGGIPMLTNLDYEDGPVFEIIEEEPVPMAPAAAPAAAPAIVVRPAKNDNGLATIEDELVPLADAPETGDPTILFGAMGILSMAGYTVLGKKKEEEEA